MTSHSHQHQQQHLIPRLPNSVVLDCLLPRLPWYTRPRMRSVSKAWKEALDRNLAYAALTRLYCRLQDGLVMVHHTAEQAPEEWYETMSRQSFWAPAPHALSIYDDESKQWRLLPPIPAVRHPLRIPCDCGVVCVDRKIFVMGGWDPYNVEVGAQVHMLDLGSGAWHWERRRNMPVPKEVTFDGLSVARKIYVLGGSSTARVGEIGEHVAPEAYDVDRDHWSQLPRVNTQGFHANRLVAAGQQVIAFGNINDGSMAMKVYNPVSNLWSDWDFNHVSDSDYLGCYYELRDGIVYKLDNCSEQLWIAFNGKLSTKNWEWQGEEIWVSDSSEVGSYLFVNESSKTYVYGIVGYYRDSTLWRGDMDTELKTVAWREVELPGNLYMCGNMCHFH